jgi:hypothetical protein
VASEELKSPNWPDGVGAVLIAEELVVNDVEVLVPRDVRTCFR